MKQTAVVDGGQLARYLRCDEEVWRLAATPLPFPGAHSAMAPWVLAVGAEHVRDEVLEWSSSKQGWLCADAIGLVRHIPI